MSATKLVQPKTKRGRRILEARAPKLVGVEKVGVYCLVAYTSTLQLSLRAD